MKMHARSLLCLAVGAALTAPAVNAQSLEEIVVTAQKRVESL